jgi:citrate synthase
LINVGLDPRLAREGKAMQALANGLEGVVVAETKLSDVQGDVGRLIIAGADVEDLAGRVPFEEVAARLVPGLDLGEGRRRAWEMARLVPLPDGMDALRATVAQLPVDDPSVLAGAVAVFAAAWSRAVRGEQPIPPDPSLEHAADYLRMLLGSSSEPLARALDAYLVTVVDHGMNASTFAARVVASTGSDMVSAVTAAIGALKGPLHGGAPGPVLDMLDAIATAERAEAWVRAEVSAGRRIMGMGHRVYRVRDPRAAVLEREVERLEAAGSAVAAATRARLALARATEAAAERVLSERHKDRALRANVEFYTAVLLEAIGVPRAAFSPTFAVGRVAGWCAHVLEQRRTGRLIRPASRYVGAEPA